MFNVVSLFAAELKESTVGISGKGLTWLPVSILPSFLLLQIEMVTSARSDREEPRTVYP